MDVQAGVEHELDEAGADSPRARLEHRIEVSFRQVPERPAGVLQDLLVPTRFEDPRQRGHHKAGSLLVRRRIEAAAKVRDREGAGPEHGEIDVAGAVAVAAIATAFAPEVFVDVRQDRLKGLVP
jgi:hypothetical protein